MIRNATFFISGLLFSVGLVISGMTQPSKVVGFLDFTGAWDPSLALVMGGAVLVYAVGLRLILKRSKPVFGLKFSIPTRRDLDGRLIAGAALFGVGWGLGGFCPGPALASLPTGSLTVVVFAAAMLVGMLLFGRVDEALAQRSRARQAPNGASTAR